MSEDELEIHEQKGNHVLHIRGDSDSDLEALFKSVINPTDTQVSLIVPMRLRKLPKSFFKPPETGSRTPPQQTSTSSRSGLPASGGTTTGLQIHHPRARSSPASLQQSLIPNEPPPQQHARQQSYDISDDLPLPPGWEMSKTLTGQRYFLK
uniref:WW domain-containing protein n=1 Tax=Strigamia maritima TaxID=126957 RepID=T1IUK9_STRMM